MSSDETKDLAAAHAAPPPADGRELRDLHGEGEALRRYCLDNPTFAERYEGWDELGRGGYGTVIRTLCRTTGSVVAVKLMARFGDSDHWRFKVEAQALARIVHPSVVRTFSAFSHGPLAWIEMEYVAGVTLGRELRRKRQAREPWPLSEALAVALSAAEGLTAVHAAGVVHRDIKPDNILLPSSRCPPAKVVDFGIARLLDASSYTRTGWIPGTPLYGAPELLNGEPVGPQADVYALCLTLYRLFADGMDPYALVEDASVSEIVYAHTRKAPIPLGSLAPSVPDDVADVIRRGLDKTPKNRPSAHDVAGVLRAALVDVQGEAEVSVPRAVRPRRVAGARVAVAVAAGVSMLMLMSVMAAWRYGRGSVAETEGASVTAGGPAPAPPPSPAASPTSSPWPAPVVASASEARLHVKWAAPGVVGVYNDSGLDLVDVTVRVAGEAYPVGAVAADEEAWVFTARAGAITAEAVASDGTRVVSVGATS